MGVRGEKHFERPCVHSVFSSVAARMTTSENLVTPCGPPPPLLSTQPVLGSIYDQIGAFLSIKLASSTCIACSGRAPIWSHLLLDRLGILAR